MTEMPKPMSEIDIIESSDIDQLATDTYINKVVADFWKQKVDDGDLVIMAAKDNGNYVARLGIWLKTDEPEINEYYSDLPTIKALVVNEDSRRQGHAKVLMNSAHDWLKSNGYDKVGLGVLEDNFNAIELYNNLGYKKQKIGPTEMFKTSWLEVLPSGDLKRQTVDTVFMLKEL
jgi:ribosomal protein S18 acetylase RimI-like enzyme